MYRGTDVAVLTDHDRSKRKIKRNSKRKKELNKQTKIKQQKQKVNKQKQTNNIILLIFNFVHVRSNHDSKKYILILIKLQLVFLID